MSVTNFNTENRTYRQLIGNGLIYKVPRFQRDYSWGVEQWDDLWADIQELVEPNGEKAHYMGYLVLQTQDNRSFDIIDGQQRLTTLSLIVLAGMKVINNLILNGNDIDANSLRLKQLQSTYIGYLDPVTLTSRPKLTLNKNNDSYFKDYLVPMIDPLPTRGFSASVHVMRKGFEIFCKYVYDNVKYEQDQGKAIAQLIESISDRLFFTVITVTDQLNAYKVFETLNARGVQLSSTDLLKNYLFSILDESSSNVKESDELERRWDNMVGRLGSESLPDFLRMHWNSRHDFTRQAELFKTIRANISNREEVFQLLRDMDADIDVYLALTQPDASDWNAKFQNHAKALRMFSVKQPIPMLLAAKRRFNNEDFYTILNATEVISFRYNVIGGQHPGEQERVYTSVAQKISNGTYKSANEVLYGLKGIYISDDEFKTAFSRKSIKVSGSRNAKVVRYILSSLQDSDLDFSSFSIEHILPQNPIAGWAAFQDRDIEMFVNRLGNMVLLETVKNRSVGNEEFDAKRNQYQHSDVPLTRFLGEQYNEWNPENLENFQIKLAKKATTVWKISQLS